MATRRKRGEGRIYLRGTTWWIAYSHRGKKYWESSESTQWHDARRLLRKRLGEIDSGRHAPDAERVGFEDLVTILIDDYRLNGRRSLRRAEASLKHLRRAFGSDRAVDITADRLTAYARERMEDSAAPASVVNELAALKRAFSLAVRVGRLPHRPAFPTIQLDNARKGFFEEPEFRALLGELPEYLRGPISFAYLTGWRVNSEVLPLRWTQVDLAAGIVRLEPGSTKNREGRTFPLRALPELESLLHEQRARTDDAQRATSAVIPWVFHRRGKPIRDFRDGWETACRRAALLKDANGKPVERDGKVVIVRPELLGRIPHDFRRTAVRNLVRAGVSERVAMQLTGHKTRAVFDRYDIVNERDLAEGVTKLAALRSSQAETVRTVLPFPSSETVGRQSAAGGR